MNSNEYFETFTVLDDILSFLGYVVDEYGSPIGLKLNENDNLFFEGVHHDYVYFCFTKMLRSCCAFNELAKKGFREDCMAIGRIIYETYLQLSNALKNPKFIEVSVFQTLKLKVGQVDFVKINGRVNRNKVFDHKLEKVLNHDLRTTTLVKRTLSSVDMNLHELFYKFMSELIHSNFITSGNYRTQDNLKYNVDTNKPHVDVLFVISYLLFLTFEQMEYYHYKFEYFDQTDFTVPTLLEFSCLKEKLRDILVEIIDIIEISDDIEGTRKKFLERIAQKLF
jgi:hypothetical protein